jgi:hypothetical protein
MLTSKNCVLRSIISSGVLLGVCGASLFVTQVAAADGARPSPLEGYKFPEKVTAFEVQGQAKQVFVMGESGQSWNVDSSGVTLGKTFKVDPMCNLKSQWPNFLNLGMTFNGIFFVGMGQVCFKDDVSLSIKKVADFKISNLDFSISYLGELDNSSLFVLNGKGPNPAAEDGYLNLINVSKSDYLTTSRALLTDVFGYSGGMRSNAAESKLYVTYSYGDAEANPDSLPKNELYEVKISELLDLASKNLSAPFSSVAKQKIAEIKGLTFSLSENDTSFVYQNFDTGGLGFSVQKSDATKTNLSTSCEVIVGWGAQWLSKCNGEVLTLAAP